VCVCVCVCVCVSLGVQWEMVTGLRAFSGEELALGTWQPQGSPAGQAVSAGWGRLKDASQHCT